jgi:TatD DNase family protein
MLASLASLAALAYIFVKPMALFDSHAHVAFKQFDADRAAVIGRAHAAGLTGWLEVGTDVASSQRAVELAMKQTGVFATVGVHPSDIGEVTEADWVTLEAMLAQECVVAVGEVGIDFYRGGTLKPQLRVLERFVRLAREHSLPVVFHVRDAPQNPSQPPLIRGGEQEKNSPPDKGESEGVLTHNAHDALIQYLESLPLDARPRGVIHTFSGTSAQAQQYLALGLYLSFSGVVTFKNAGDMAEAAKTVPLDRFLIETDCPFLAPQQYRGQRNEPAYVRFVAEKVAELRGESVEAISEASWRNAQRLFALPQ